MSMFSFLLRFNQRNSRFTAIIVMIGIRKVFCKKSCSQIIDYTKVSCTSKNLDIGMVIFERKCIHRGCKNKHKFQTL